TQRIDVDYLVRYTNAPWLIIRDPGAADDGLIARDESGRPLAFDKATNRLLSALAPAITPPLSGAFRLADQRPAVAGVQLLAERSISEEYRPGRVAATPGVAAPTTRRLAAELAQVAFQEQIVLPIPWTDWTGRRHDQVIGRPVGMHAMRGISAHANGFHTCR